jgi:hypothetical protein
MFIKYPLCITFGGSTMHEHNNNKVIEAYKEYSPSYFDLIISDVHRSIFEKCNELGSMISDFMINSLENSLENKPELDKIVPNILKSIESIGNTPRPEYRTKPRVTINDIPSGKGILKLVMIMVRRRLMFNSFSNIIKITIMNSIRMESRVCYS